MVSTSQVSALAFHQSSAGPVLLPLGRVGAPMLPRAVLPTDERLPMVFQPGNAAGVEHRDGWCLGVRVGSALLPEASRARTRSVGRTFVLDQDAVVAWSDPKPPGAVLAAELVSLARSGPGVGVIGSQVATIERLEGPRSLVTCRLAPLRSVPVPTFAALTPAQMEIVLLSSSGLTAQEIGEHTRRGAETVRSHLRSAYKRLGIGTRSELGPIAEEWHRWVRSE